MFLLLRFILHNSFTMMCHVCLFFSEDILFFIAANSKGPFRQSHLFVQKCAPSLIVCAQQLTELSQKPNKVRWRGGH